MKSLMKVSLLALVLTQGVQAGCLKSYSDNATTFWESVGYGSGIGAMTWGVELMASSEADYKPSAEVILYALPVLTAAGAIGGGIAYEISRPFEKVREVIEQARVLSGMDSEIQRPEQQSELAISADATVEQIRQINAKNFEIRKANIKAAKAAKRLDNYLEARQEVFQGMMSDLKIGESDLAQLITNLDEENVFCDGTIVDRDPSKTKHVHKLLANYQEVLEYIRANN